MEKTEADANGAAWGFRVKKPGPEAICVGADGWASAGVAMLVDGGVGRVLKTDLGGPIDVIPLRLTAPAPSRDTIALAKLWAFQSRVCVPKSKTLGLVPGNPFGTVVSGAKKLGELEGAVVELVELVEAGAVPDCCPRRDWLTAL